MQKRTLTNPKIEVIWSHVVVEAYGNEKGRLAGLKLQSTKDGSVRTPFASLACWTAHTPFLHLCALIAAASVWPCYESLSLRHLMSADALERQLLRSNLAYDVNNVLTACPCRWRMFAGLLWDSSAVDRVRICHVADPRPASVGTVFRHRARACDQVPGRPVGAPRRWLCGKLFEML